MIEKNFYNAINPNYFVKNGGVANLESIAQFDGGTLIAVGLGARGKIQNSKEDIIYENHRGLNNYEKNIKDGKLSGNKIYRQNKYLEISNECRRLVLPGNKISEESFKTLAELAGENKEKIDQIFKDYFEKENGYYVPTNKGKLILDIIQGSIWENIKSNFNNKDAIE